MTGVEVVELEEEADPAGVLVADRGALVLTVGAGQENAGGAGKRDVWFHGTGMVPGPVVAVSVPGLRR